MNKQIFPAIQLTCITHDDELTCKTCKEGTLTKSGDEAIFTEVARKKTTSRSPKLLKGKKLNLAQDAPKVFHINAKKFNPYDDMDPHATATLLHDEYLRCWNVSHARLPDEEIPEA